MQSATVSNKTIPRLPEDTWKITEPPYYHRNYSNDIPTDKKDDKNSWANTAQRVGMTALPFLSLYKPFSFPISLGMGALRTYTCGSQLFASIKSGNTNEIPYQLLQTTIAVIALAGTIFAHPVGMLITTGHDLLMDVVRLTQHLQKGEYQEAMECCFSIINNALYLSLFLHGGLELAIASLAMQILIGLYSSRAEFMKGNYIEAAGHLGMSLVRGNQLAGQVKMLQLKWKIETTLKQKKIQLEAVRKSPDRVIEKRKITSLELYNNDGWSFRLNITLDNGWHLSIDQRFGLDYGQDVGIWLSSDKSKLIVYTYDENGNPKRFSQQLHRVGNENSTFYRG